MSVLCPYTLLGHPLLAPKKDSSIDCSWVWIIVAVSYVGKIQWELQGIHFQSSMEIAWRIEQQATKNKAREWAAHTTGAYRASTGHLLEENLHMPKLEKNLGDGAGKKALLEMENQSELKLRRFQLWNKILSFETNWAMFVLKTHCCFGGCFFVCVCVFCLFLQGEVRERNNIFFLETSFNLTFRKMCMAETIQAKDTGKGLF